MATSSCRGEPRSGGGGGGGWGGGERRDVSIKVKEKRKEGGNKFNMRPREKSPLGEK